MARINTACKKLARLCCRSSAVTSLALSMVVSSAIAQPSAEALERSRQELGVFSDLLSVGLGLDEPGGLFGMNVGSIQSRYLFGQGAYLEIRSPLANRRQRLSLAALSSTMRDLQSSQNPFSRFSAAPSSQESGAGAADSALVASLASRIQDVDYELIVSSALRQASEAAEALRSLEGIDDATYAGIRQELAELRLDLQANISETSEAVARANSVPTGAPDAAAVSLSEQIAPLRQLAQQKAEELGEQLEQAQSDYEQRWFAEREAFERALYTSACKASEQLVSFADSETLAIVLAGLGDEGARMRPDRMHMLSIAALRRCASGAIAPSDIGAVVYSY